MHLNDDLMLQSDLEDPPEGAGKVSSVGDPAAIQCGCQQRKCNVCVIHACFRARLSLRVARKHK